MIKKLEVDFEPNINHKDLTCRKYTLTHSDETGQRYLFIGGQYAEDRYNKLRDEVIGKWSKTQTGFGLNIMCTLYSEFSSLSVEKRYEKFKQHMPRAIQAIVNGDKEYIVSKKLFHCSVIVRFLSDSMPSEDYYGTIVDYMEGLSHKAASTNPPNIEAYI